MSDYSNLPISEGEPLIVTAKSRVLDPVDAVASINDDIIDRTMSFPYSPNFYLTTNRENIEKHFLGEKRVASIFDINADEGYFLSRAGGQNSFITNLEFSYGYETGGNDHSLILTIKDSNGDFENQFLSNDYLAENFIKLLKTAEKTINDSLSSGSDREKLNSLSRSRNLLEVGSQTKLVLYFAFGTSENTQYWAGPFRASLTKAELRISSEGLREIDLVFTAENSIIKCPYLGLKNSVEDYNTFYGYNDIDFSLVSLVGVIPRENIQKLNTPPKKNPTEKDYVEDIKINIHDYVERLIIGYMKDAFKSQNIITILPDMEVVLNKAINSAPKSLGEPGLEDLTGYLMSLFRINLVISKSNAQTKRTANSKDYNAETNKINGVTLKFGHITIDNDEDPTRVFPNFYKPLAMFSDTPNREEVFKSELSKIITESQKVVNQRKKETASAGQIALETTVNFFGGGDLIPEENTTAYKKKQADILFENQSKQKTIEYNKKYSSYSKKFTVKEEINLDIINYWFKLGLIENPDDPVYIFGNEDVIKDILYNYSKGTILSNFESPDVDYGDLLENYLVSIPGERSSKVLNKKYFNNEYASNFSKVIFRNLPTSRDIYGADKALLSLDLSNGEALNSAIKNKINLPIFLFNTQNSNILSLVFETNNQYLDLLLAQPISSKAKLVSETLDSYKNKIQDVVKSYFGEEQLKFILGLEEGQKSLLEDLESGKSGAELKAQVSERIKKLIIKDYEQIKDLADKKFSRAAALFNSSARKRGDPLPFPDDDTWKSREGKANVINSMIKDSITRKFYSPLNYNERTETLTPFKVSNLNSSLIDELSSNIIFYSIYTPSNIKVVSKGDNDVLSRKVSLNEELNNRIYTLNIRTLPMFHISSQYFILSESIVLAKKINSVESPVGGSLDTSFEPFSGAYILNGFRHVISTKDAYSEFKLQKI